MKTLKCRIMLTFTITTFMMFVSVFIFCKPLSLCVASLNYSMNFKILFCYYKCTFFANVIILHDCIIILVFVVSN